MHYYMLCAAAAISSGSHPKIIGPMALAANWSSWQVVSGPCLSHPSSTSSLHPLAPALPHHRSCLQILLSALGVLIVRWKRIPWIGTCGTSGMGHRGRATPTKAPSDLNDLKLARKMLVRISI